MPDLIRHPFLSWIPAFARKTGLAFIVAGVINSKPADLQDHVLIAEILVDVQQVGGAEGVQKMGDAAGRRDVEIPGIFDIIKFPGRP
jgi:hypothetical protein